ncbi:bone marrow stromal antigen 2 [Manis pentadactyla]|uniref:bone marrow stromal antigen 2 n=1 Tax=Manis pentadactyla TaxID=143292 RepID=UPI00255C9EE1|nr:bone marrow stromal antigen 2 [Manis pentadactyla]
MVDCSKESVLRDHRVPWWLVVLLVLVVVGLTVGHLIYIVKANNETCKNGFQAEKECLSATHPLQQQLDQTREDLRRIKAQAATCNQTVETLKASLEAEKVHSQEKQDQVQELQGEIMNLVQKLQSTWAEVEQLRRLSETSGGETTSTSNQKKVSPFLVTGLLLLGLRALLS